MYYDEAMLRRRTPLGFRELAVAGGLSVGVLVVANGCQDATQVTLVVDLRSDIACADIAGGTAITVGADSQAVETRVARGEITTRTSACDAATRRVGTLIVTPGDTGRGAVVVVVGYRGATPESCKPPKYDGCIVARRRFSFAEHTSLEMPITIDPDCAGVECPVDATCRAGACFGSEVAVGERCPGGVCEQPGEPPKGVILLDGAPPDARPPVPVGDSGVPIGSNDAGTIINGGSGPPAGHTGPWCNPLSNNLWCPTAPAGAGHVQCGDGTRCCELPSGDVSCTSVQAACGTRPRYCCEDADCGGGVCTRANQEPGTVGRCQVGSLTCDGAQIRCPDPCVPPARCYGTTAENASCGEAGVGLRFCCSADDCDGTPCELGPEIPNRPYCTAF